MLSRLFVGKSSSRPFKQYPKDAINFSLYSLSPLVPEQDSTALQEAMKSHEAMLTVYKSQVGGAGWGQVELK